MEEKFKQYLYDCSREKAKHTVWLLSDLQQEEPALTQQCLEISIRDYEAMKAPAQMIWYLGDAVERDDTDNLIKMAKLQGDAFSQYKIPLYYALGNHDMDYCNRHLREKPRLPFWEMVKSHESDGWKTSASCEDIYFTAVIGDFIVYFFCDHVAADNSWCTTHGRVRRGQEFYPYTQQTADDIRKQLEQSAMQVITASHYAYPGGNRGSEMLGRLFPLPQNVKMHFYGHAHFGDFEWAGKDAYRRIAGTDWHDLRQFNVSSFENIRGVFCSSVLLHIYEDNSFGIFVRNHDEGIFTECFFPSMVNLPSATKEQQKLSEGKR